MSNKTKESEEYFIGTYLYPFTFLAPVDFDDPMSSAAIVSKILTEDGSEIIVTAMGGLFTRVLPELIGKRENEYGHILLDHLLTQLDFEQEVCDLFNLLICELTLNGVVSEAASPSYLGIGIIEDERVYVRYPASSPVPYYERSLAASRILHNSDELLVASFHHVDKIIGKVADLTLSEKLATVSSSLPGFVASAYSSFSRYHLDNAMLNAWIACEQIIDHAWSKYVAKLPGNKRKQRLRDNRTYTPAIQTEVLQTAGLFSETLAESLHVARKNRNNLAHNAENDYPSTVQSMDALKEILVWYLEEEISAYKVPTGPMWGFDKPKNR